MTKELTRNDCLSIKIQAEYLLTYAVAGFYDADRSLGDTGSNFNFPAHKVYRDNLLAAYQKIKVIMEGGSKEGEG